jgi:type 1 fimbria pilin
MRMRMLLVLCAALVLSLAVAATTARAAVVTNLTFPFTGYVVTNDCNGDTVSLDGIDHYVLRVTTSGSGRVNYGEHQTTDASGIGFPSGAHYDVRFELNVSLENAFLDGSGAIAETFVLKNMFIADGHVVPNLNAIIVDRITVTPNGDVTSVFTKITTKCNG